MVPLTDIQFHAIREWLYRHAGISLNDSKKCLVAGRLHKRLAELTLTDYGDYLALLQAGQGIEPEVAINLLTTNETYFFREPEHFEFLRLSLQQRSPGEPFHVWSAASASGEEAYSIAMLLADILGPEANWHIVGTDINTRVLAQARRGVYPMERAKRIPLDYLKRFCLKGVRKDRGWLKILPAVSRHVGFIHYNLMHSPALEQKFDVVFLRNVLIYFNQEDKKRVVTNVLRSLKPNGLLLVGHSESVNGYHPGLELLKPSCYRYVHVK